MPEPFVHGYTLDPPDPPDDVSEVIAARWSWASGGVVSTPADANAFVPRVRPRRRDEPGGPLRAVRVRGRWEIGAAGAGRNAAGLAVFRYRTQCGRCSATPATPPGTRSSSPRTRDGSRSTSVSVSAQITPNSDPKRFKTLRTIFGLAVSAAMEG